MLGESTQQISDAQRQLVRIGIDRPQGAATGALGDFATENVLHSYPTATFDDLAREPGAVVLDVRRDDERALGHIPGSAHIPLHALARRIDEVPDGRLWVHCATGYRAGIAASLLDRSARSVVLIDDDIENAEHLIIHDPE